MIEPASACEAECALHKARFPDVNHLTAEQLQRMLANGPVTLVDVRADAEQQVSMLPDAVPLKHVQWPLPNDAPPIVLYCTVGYRSALEARRLASQAPAAGIYSMEGILPWAHSGGSLVDPSSGAPTKRLHAFGSKWAAMSPADHRVETFDRVLSCPFLTAVLRVPVIWVLAAIAPGKKKEK